MTDSEGNIERTENNGRGCPCKGGDKVFLVSNETYKLTRKVIAENMEKALRKYGDFVMENGFTNVTPKQVLSGITKCEFIENWKNDIIY